jgi:ribosome biogenesis protein MAK21
MPHEKGDEVLEEDLEDEDDELLSDPDAADNSSVEGEEEPDTDSNGNELGDGTSFAEASDDDDLVAVDDIPNGLVEYDGSNAEAEQSDEEWGGLGGGDKRKRKDTSQARRKKRKTLPTFATYEEYARMIEEGPEDEI